MNSFFSSSKALGISVSDNTIKYVLVSKSKGKIAVEQSKTLKANCKTALHTFQALCRKVPVALLVEASNGTLREERLSLARGRDLGQVVKNKIETELQGKGVILKKIGQSRGQATFLGLKKDAVDTHTPPIKVDAYFPHIFGPLTLLGKSIPGPTLYFSSYGCDLILSESKVIPFSQKDPEFKQKLLIAIFQHCRNAKTKHLHYFGASSDKIDLLESIEKLTPYSTKKVPLNLPKEAEKYSLEMGAALAMIEESYPSYAPKPRSLKSLIKQNKKHLMLSLGLLVLSATIQFTAWHLKSLEGKRRNQTLYTEITSHPLLNNKGAMSLQYTPKLSVQQIKSSLSQSGKKNLPYSLAPTVPGAHETLAWFKKLHDELKGDSLSPFIIDQFEYRLTELPSFKNPKAQYSCRVRLSFTARTPEIARMIHKKLLSANSFIQTHRKLNWSYQNGRYETSFFLKNTNGCG